MENEPDDPAHESPLLAKMPLLLLEAVMPSTKVSPALVIDSKCQSLSGRMLFRSSTQLGLLESSMLNTYLLVELAPSRFTLASSVNGLGRVSGFKRNVAVVWPAGMYHDGHLAAARQLSGEEGGEGGGDGEHSTQFIQYAAAMCLHVWVYQPAESQ